MVIKPAKTWRDKQGNPKKKPGEYIQFMNGKFETDKKKEQDFIKKYMDTHPNEIFIVDPKEIEKQERIQKKAKELIEQEDAEALKAEKEKKSRAKDFVNKEKESRGQDVYGKSPKEDNTPGKYQGEDDEEQKKSKGFFDKLEDKLKKNQISRKDLLTLAAENDIELTDAELKDFNVAKKKVFEHLQSQLQEQASQGNAAGEEEPNLDDESEE